MTAPRQQAASDQDTTIVRAGDPDTGVLSELIADAFFPLTVSRWLIPDGADRREIFPVYFRLYVRQAISDGLALTTPGRDAAALWLPANGPAEPPPGYNGQLAAITSPYLANFRKFDDELASRHPAGVPHHHLALLAVLPGRQGNGIGTALLRHHHAQLDDEGVPAYLEAADQRTRQLYLAHGYTDRGSPVEFAPGVRMYPMWRDPRPGAAAG